ncbi:hypothetical protein PU560_16890 [Georgenia sp. 10Sc9-8]|uniref:Lipoprotein LpqN n=1 Tax=Georgenia halotolerans TaxID=3028317 RepID=A0ABT5U1D5_9MICO|nr:hypothetical protein [Georgenia halotolerans]
MPDPSLAPARATLVVLLILLAGCATTGQQGPTAPTTPPPTEVMPAPTKATPAPTTTTAPPEVDWHLPEVAGYEAEPATVPGVQQLTSVRDSCLYQLAEDRVPPGTSDADAELVEPALRALGGEPTGAVTSTFVPAEGRPDAEGRWEAVEVSFTAEVYGQPAQGVVLVSVPPGSEMMLSVSYVCTDRPVPEETWQALREGTEVTVTRAD